MDGSLGGVDKPDALLRKVARGDREALGALFGAEAGRLVAIARRIVGRADLAEEVVQEAFVSIWRAAPRFDPRVGSARTWMATIVRNRARNLLRDGARLDYVDENELSGFRERAGASDAAYAALPDSEALKACLEQLEPLRRRSILLAYVAGFTHGEIAAELKAPIGTVKAWIRRGVAALQECLS
ncbi:MAG: sigma-70 family RNA polymerase sigma factor [Rhizobiaceae bacterium]